MIRATVLAMALALSMSAGSLHAQADGQMFPGAVRDARRAAAEQRRERMQDGQPNRTQLLQLQIRRSLWRVAKLRLGFSDEQMLRLERTTQRFDQQRRALAQEERAQRVVLRAEVLADSSADQAAIASALEQLHAVQQRRLDLQAAEQRDFATFMSPLQRAKFTVLQEQVRRRLQDMTRARPDSAAGAPPDAP